VWAWPSAWWRRVGLAVKLTSAPVWAVIAALVAFVLCYHLP